VDSDVDQEVCERHDSWTGQDEDLGHHCSRARQHHVPEWAEQIPVGHVRTVRLTRRGVTFEVVEKMAVVGHLVLDLTARRLDVLRVDAGSGRERAGRGHRWPELGARGLAGAGRSLILGEDVQRVTVWPYQEDPLRSFSQTYDLPRRPGPADAL
jgi:hypothetical protein